MSCPKGKRFENQGGGSVFRKFGWDILAF